MYTRLVITPQLILWPPPSLVMIILSYGSNLYKLTLGPQAQPD
jgi:hypothetical protein